MRVHPLAWLVLAACGRAPISPQDQTGTSDDEAAIRGLAGKYAEFFNASNAAGLSGLVTDDFETITAEGTHVRGRLAFRQMEDEAARGRQGQGLNLRLTASPGYVKWINSSHAVAGGRYTMAGLPAGAPDKGSWMVVTKKSADSQWLIAHSLVSEYVAPTTPPAADTRGKPKGK